MKQVETNCLRREIGLASAVVVVVANMIGTGAFTTSGFIFAELGCVRALLIVWLLGGLFSLAGALCYGELGAMFPCAGGEYAYLKQSFGPLPAFLSGWISLVVGFSAPVAAAAIAFATYVLGPRQPVLMDVGFGGYSLSLSMTTVLACTVVMGLSLIHFHSLRMGQRIQNLLTAFKIGFILLFVGAGFLFGEGDVAHLSQLFSGSGVGLDLPKVAVALIFVSFAYSGWNAAAYLGGEIRRPGRNLPRALILGTTLVGILYLLLNVLYVYALPANNMSGMLEIGKGAATALFGTRVGQGFALAIAVGLISAISAMIMAGPRVYFAMAADGLFFRSFGVVDAARNTPGRAILFQAGIAMALIVSATFDALLIYIGFTLSLFAMLTVAGLMWLRHRYPHLPRPYRTWGYPLTPLFFIGGNLWIVVYSLASRPIVALYGLATVLVGGVLYAWFRPVAAVLPGSSRG